MPNAQFTCTEGVPHQFQGLLHHHEDQEEE